MSKGAASWFHNVLTLNGKVIEFWKKKIIEKSFK